ncbi:MAG: DNA gyrase subunit B [Pirellulales bacterium]|nr:DNA gyrase subunit B [Pirellulales bacterium]
MAKEKQQSEYSADDLQHLSDRDHVRKRPGMYIGDTFSRGLHHLVYEVVDNSIDEAMADFASHVTVVINNDGSVTVEDNGRGIPVEEHKELTAEMGRTVSTLEGVMTVLKFGGKFEKGAYQTSGGLHGVGVTVVNFLSQWCEVEVSRDGFVYRQEYERGEATGDVTKGEATDQTGTKTTFKPDSEIFESTKYVSDILVKRLQELAFLNKGVTIIFRDDRSGLEEEFCYEDGIIEFVKHLNRASDDLQPDVFYVTGEYVDEDNADEPAIGYELAFQYTNEFTENLHSYVNNIHTIEGGTHETGFKRALTRILNQYALSNNLLKNNDNTPDGSDFREGITAVISVKVAHPQFEGQTKTKLGNREVDTAVNSICGDSLTKYLDQNPKIARIIVNKGIIAMEARLAARKARDLLRKRKSALGGNALPGKLRDCISNEMERCELYLVEGDSAGGSAEGGRMREFQAILPLRGKIINAYKSREDKVLANEEVQSMINAIGCGIGEEQDTSKRRYGKTIIMTDADVDGSHIRTLLLCFFYRQMNQLVEQGHVYLAQPPLFRVRQGRKVHYVQTEEEMKGQLLEKGLSDATFNPGDGQQITGEELEHLCRLLASMEESIVALERRGVNLKAHAERMDLETSKLPVFRVTHESLNHWFVKREDVDAFVAEHSPAPPEEPANEKNEEGEEAEDHTPAAPTLPVVQVPELHEVRTINGGLTDLAEFGFDIQSLITQERTGEQEPRYTLAKGDNVTNIEDLRGLLGAVRAAGEKGLQITRFKGLGEMNAEELRETTLDPENRTLIKVTMDDLGAASQMFSILMGDKVEPRREFIEKHALDIQNLDV